MNATTRAVTPRALACLSLAVAAATLLTACGSARVTRTTDLNGAPAKRPMVIYVADFDLDAQSIESEPGVVPRLDSPGPVRRLLFGQSNDPQVVARHLVNSMAEAIVKDLKKAGLDSTRLKPAAPVPAQGWLVRGVFTEVQEGNQVHRALIGFGMGATELQVITDLADLANGPPAPFYEVQTEANSSKAPGAGPALAFHPGITAARFALAGNDLNQNVKQTASKISEQITQRLGTAK